MTENEAFNRVKNAGLVPMPVYHNTFQLARSVLDAGVPGDFVECGVFAGAQVALMALAALDHPAAAGRKFHLFDSFEGIPVAGPNDREQPGIGPLPSGGSGAMVSSGISACSVETVKAHMAKWGVPDDMLVYHKGWFQDTVPLWPKDQPIALLRLDGDLYESTLVCLQHLYPQLSERGICIVDDCNLHGCATAVTDYFGCQIPRHVVAGGDGAEWFVKPHAGLVNQSS